MEAKKTVNTNPLGLNIDFMFGRGYLWATQERLSDWITLESLRMEIPDLQFPFDARGGLARFRNTRCLVRQIELGISEAGLQELIERAASHLDGFEDLRVRLIEGAAHVSLKLGAFGADTYVSFRVALIPPEPTHVDEIHLSIYDYRAFGPLPYPARVLAYELLTSLLNTPVLRPSGRGESFTVGIAGDILSFRPIKLLLLHLFPGVGWKLPNLSNVVLDGARIRPGQLTVRASSRDPQWNARAHDDRTTGGYALTGTMEGSRAVAAYEAKDLFASVDEVIFDGDIDVALQQLATYREVYGPHPELIARTLDCLLADPNATNLAEAKAIIRESLSEDPEDLRALLAQPIVAKLERRDLDEILEHYDDLSEVLRKRQNLDDWVLGELAAAQLLVERQPARAAERLRGILKLSPRNLEALEKLRGLYKRAGEWTDYEEILKRLTGVYTSREDLKRTYMELGRHLMDRRGQSSEAKIYLERVLRLEPGNLEALDALGEGYALNNEPLRALKAFASAARAAEAADHFARAGALYHRVAMLWRDDLDNASEALLSCRRALQLSTRAEAEEDEEFHPRDLIMYLESAAELAEARERWDEALNWRTELIPRIEALIDAPRTPDDEESTRRSLSSALAGLATLGEVGPREERDPLEELHQKLVDAQRAIARLYMQRDRPDAAAPHWRRLLELDPHDEQAASRLEQHWRAAGSPEQLIGFYKELIDRAASPAREVELHRKLARLYDTMQMTEEATDQLRAALRIRPEEAAPREQLVDLLRGSGRFETLRDALSNLLVKVQDRDARHDILLDLGRLQLHHLEQPRQATRNFFEALDLRPSDAAALSGAEAALRAIIEREGPDTPAPVGPDTAARLLERILQRLVDLAQDPLDRAQRLDELAALAEARGATGAANEARRRATSLRRKLESSGQAPSSVDQRLDALLGPATQPVEDDEDDLGDLPKEMLALGTSKQSDGFKRDSSKQRTRPEVNLQQLADRTGEAWDNLDIDKALDDALSPPDDEGIERTEVEETVRGGDEQGQDGEEVSDFRAKFRDLWKKPGSLDAPDASEALSKLVGSSKKRGDAPNLSIAPPETPPAEPETEAALTARIEAARQSESWRRLANALVTLLERHLDPDDALTLPEERVANLSAEAGETLYYELEENSPALPHLERARDLAPDGVGGSTSVLNALEAIYEDQGAVDERIALLQARLDRAETTDLATTYRLLIAQLLWDELRDRDAATARLQQILDHDARHEAAHRLLAQIAEDVEDWSEATSHYEIVLSERSGGLDEVELERDLADIYLHQLDKPDRAQRHYESVLKSAPADAQAIEGIKQCQSMREDWLGYVDTLGREYGLLIGDTDGVDLAADEGVDVGRPAPSLRMTASQIVADAAYIIEEQMEDTEQARLLWKQSYQLYPENAEALERRIALDRQTNAYADLAEDLEEWANLLLDPIERFEALVEAATVFGDELLDTERSRGLLAEAIAVVEEVEDPPERLGEVRRRLQHLQSE